MEYVYQILAKEILALVDELPRCNDIEKKAELIGNKNLLEHAIKLLKKCDQHGIYAGAIFTKLPKKLSDTPSSEYRIIEDGEKDDPQYWQEVVIEGKPDNSVRLGEGDVVIEC